MTWVNKALATKPITKEYAQSVVDRGRSVSPEVAKALIGMVLELGGWELDAPEAADVIEHEPVMCEACEGEGKVTDDEQEMSIQDVTREVENDESGRSEMALVNIDWKSCPACGGAGSV